MFFTINIFIVYRYIFMEIKKLKSMRMRRGGQGERSGQGETGLGNILNSPNLFNIENLQGLFKNLGIKTEDNAADIKIADFPLIYRWATFINFLSNKTPENTEKEIQVELTEEQILLKSKMLAEEIKMIEKQKAERDNGSGSGSRSGKKRKSPRPVSARRSGFIGLIKAIINRPASARPASARPASARPASARPASARTVSTNSRVKSSNSFILPKISPKKLVADESLTGIITEFDDAFKGILTVVNSGASSGASSNFKNMMSIVKRLPDIDTTLPYLLRDKNKNLKDRYNAILYLLKSKCSGGWKGAICSAAISILRDKDIQGLYDKLKENADNDVKITDEVLIKFIEDVVPIMKKKLNNMVEFEKYLNKLDKIQKDLNMYRPAKGGKKSTKKVILGKERCIYKVKGSNKDHIKYKGTLITVADYKKLMRGLMRI